MLPRSHVHLLAFGSSSCSHSDAAGENKSGHSNVGLDLRKVEAETEDFTCTLHFCHTLPQPLLTRLPGILHASSEEGRARIGAGDPAGAHREGLEAEGSSPGTPRGDSVVVVELGARTVYAGAVRNTRVLGGGVQKINEKPTVINQYESGKAIPHPQLISRLERALGVKLPRPPKKGKKKNKK